MAFPPLSEIQACLDREEVKRLPTLAVSVLRNIVLEPMLPYLRYLAFQAGYNAHVRFGQYDNVFQEALGGDGELLSDSTDCVLVFTYLESLSPILARQFAGLARDKIQEEIDRIGDYVVRVVKGIRGQTDAPVIWHSLEVPLYPALGIGDWQITEGQSEVIRRLNSRILDVFHGFHGCHLMDMNCCVARVGGSRFYDLRLWHTARAPYSPVAMQEVALTDFQFIRALKGKAKKCLVLDCDNTLWGGVVGEDGPAGIRLGTGYPGSPYREFQEEILSLHRRGVILALCSKNNEADVWEVFDRHPDMVLRREHISAWRINWQDKVTGLRQIAADLNIGTDSMVFVDDSEFEANLVSHALPEVQVIPLPTDKAVEYRALLAGCGLFDTLTLSAEDLNRGAMYRAEAVRRTLREAAGDLEDYLRSLEMVLSVSFATTAAIPRIAQQTQRTNQFNLTSRRYDDAQIATFLRDSGTDILTARLADRLGDLGSIGVCILCCEGSVATIDTLLLSCRALGRRVEDAFLTQVLTQARNRGCSVVVGKFVRTSKNGQVESFYPRHGFQEVSCEGDGVTRVFEYRLDGPAPTVPGCFKEICSEVEVHPNAS